MNYQHATAQPHFSGQIDLVDTTMDPALFEKDKSNRKLAMTVMSFALIIAVGCIALIIGSGTADAASLPVFTTANAMSAKQDAGVGGIAVASITFVAFGALALFSTKK